MVSGWRNLSRNWGRCVVGSRGGVVRIHDRRVLMLLSSMELQIDSGGESDSGGDIHVHSSLNCDSLQRLENPISQEEERGATFQNLLTHETSLYNGVDNLDEELEEKTSTLRCKTAVVEHPITAGSYKLKKKKGGAGTTATSTSRSKQHQKSRSPELVIETGPYPWHTSANYSSKSKSFGLALHAGPQMIPYEGTTGRPRLVPRIYSQHNLGYVAQLPKEILTSSYPLQQAVRTSSSGSEEYSRPSSIGTEGHQGDDNSESKPAYPRRPAQPRCKFYMRTGKCRFGSNCYFDHPEGLPSEEDIEKQIEKDKNERMPCEHFMRTGTCAYGDKCCFRHSSPESPNDNASSSPATSRKKFPQRPGTRLCHFYMRTGKCAYGHRCKWHHPPPSPYSPQFLPVTPMVVHVMEPKVSPSPQYPSNNVNLVYVPQYQNSPYDLPSPIYPEFFSA